MTHTLTITLLTPDNQPVVGVVVTIRPVDINPTDSGLVVSSVDVTTDSVGRASIDLLPSTAGSYYSVSFQAEGIDIPTRRFRMPAQDTALDDILRVE